MMKYKLKQLVLVDENGVETTVDMPFDNVDITQEYGLRKHFAGGMYAEHESNGQSRMLLKAWSGCSDYDDFKTDA